MTEGSNDLELRFGAQVAGALSGINTVTHGIEEMGATVKNITGVFSALSESVIAAFAVERIEHFIETISALGEEAYHTSEMLGLSTAQVTEFQYAAELSGSSAQGAAMSMIRLSNNIQSALSGTGRAADAFKALGVSQEELKAHSTDLSYIMNRIADVFKESADGPAKTAIALALMSRAGAQMIPTLNEGSAGLAELARQANDAGVVIGDAMAKRMTITNDTLTELHKAFQGISISIYEAFEPAIQTTIAGLIELVEGFRRLLDQSSPVHDFFGLIVGAVDLVIGAIATFTSMLKDATIMIVSWVAQTTQAFITMGQIANSAMHLDWNGIQSAWKDGMERLDAIAKEAAQEQLDNWNAYAATLKKLFSNIGWSEKPPPAETPREGGKKELANIGEMGAANQASTRVAEWKAALDQQIADQIGFFRDSTALEISYWQNILDVEKLSVKERQDVEKNLFEARKKAAQADLQEQLAIINDKMAADKNHFDEVMKLEDQKLALLKQDYGEDSRQYAAALREKERMLREHQATMDRIAVSHAQTTQQIELLGLQNQRANLDAQVEMGQISNQQKIAALAQLAQQEYQITLNELNQELAQTNLTEQEIEAIYDKQRLAKAKLSNDLAELGRQEAAQETAAYREVWQSIGGAFDQMVTGILQGTQTWQEALRNAASNIIVTFTEMIAKLLLQWLAFQAAMSLGWTQIAGAIGNPLTGGGLGGLIGGLIGGGGGATGAATGVAQAATQTANTAAVTANTAAVAGSTAATAASATTVAASETAMITVMTTLVGTMTTLIGAITAEISALAANTAAQGAGAAGGGIGLLSIFGLATGAWNIPGNVIAQLHPGEMVLPADAASMVRATGSVRGYDSGSPATSYGGGDQHIHIHAWDSRDVASFVQEHSQTLARVVAEEWKFNPRHRPDY